MKKLIDKNFPYFLHGADYNPEQWKNYDGIWDQDMSLMKKANCNEMTVGIFSWSDIEKEEGKFDFSVLDEIIDKVYKNGGKVVLATPSGARPHWLADKYPEVLRVNENGVKMHFGRRHNHCYTSPVYREKVRIINTELAKRYGNHPAVIAWHISNEYGGMCYCDKCQQAFRDFLKKKYDNDINKLNEAYWSAFWSHTYDNFDQIEAPMNIGEKSIHGLNLDWRRFVTHQTIDFMNVEIKALRDAGSSKPVTTNMMQGYYELDYNEFANHIDVASWDAYPDWHLCENLYVAPLTAFWHDYFRSLKDAPFMLMESAPALVNWKGVNKIKRPNLDVLQSMQAVAHGSDTVQYFQWRKSRGSVEKFHGAVVDHVGNDKTRIFNEVKRTGAILKNISEISGTITKSKVAILYDWNNMWALDDSQGFQKDKKYQHTCVEYYKPLWEKGVSVDIIGPKKDFSKYDLVILPMLYLVDSELKLKIKDYVANGGTVYATYMLGYVNENDLCYLGGFPCEELKEVFGIWNEEIDSLTVQDKTIIKCNDKEYIGKDYSEIIHLQGANALAYYDSEFYKGTPCYTVNHYKKGKAYYQAFRDDGMFKKDALNKILSDLNIDGDIKEEIVGVTSTKRTDGENEYLFVQNYNEEVVENIKLKNKYVSMIDGKEKDVVNLDSYGIDILKRKI